MEDQRPTANDTQAPDVAAIQKRLDAITDGPWEAWAGIGWPKGWKPEGAGVAWAVQSGARRPIAYCVEPSDQAFIAYAPADLRACLAYIATLQRRLTLTDDGDADQIAVLTERIAELERTPPASDETTALRERSIERQKEGDAWHGIGAEWDLKDVCDLADALRAERDEARASHQAAVAQYLEAANDRDEARARGEAACAAWGVDKVKMHDLAAVLQATLDCDYSSYDHERDHCACTQARAALKRLDDAGRIDVLTPGERADVENLRARGMGGWLLAIVTRLAPRLDDAPQGAA